MLEIVLIIITIVIVIFISLMRKGNLKFFKIVSLDPDEFYNYIKSNDSWRLSKVEGDVDLEGPYKVYVPSLGEQIIYYVVLDDLKQAQTDYIEYFNKLKN